MPTTGKIYEARMPSWQNSVANLLFVLKTMTEQHPGLDPKQVLLISHSQGGDASMLFAQLHPKLVQHVISLDHRRVPMPRTRQPLVLSIRSSDQVADPGVLPSAKEQSKFGIRIVQLPATLHNDMWDGATAQQKAEILSHIDRFLLVVP